MNWLKEWLGKFKDWLIDALIYVLQKVFSLFLEALAWVIESLPMPDFIMDNTLASAIDPDIVWMLNQSGVSVGLGIISSAYVFRLMRKLLTLGKW